MSASDYAEHHSYDNDSYDAPPLPSQRANTAKMASVSALCWATLAHDELDALIDGKYDDGNISDATVLELVQAQLDNALRDVETALSLAKESGR